ncbi:MAG: hypothetical protein RIQ78_293 [Bacteroidota bacterium]|jgi:lysophospholipase L1-like esterase
MRYFVSFVLLSCFFSTSAQPFRKEIQAFQRLDSITPPPPGQVLFVGSSSFRLWHDVQTYFPETPILNRGFGGSCLTDLIYYEKQIIKPYAPRKILIYCGENDLADSDTTDAHDILMRFSTLFELIRADFPHTPLAYVSIKPSPSRRRLMPKMIQANALIQEYLHEKPNTNYVDIFHPMLNENGEPRQELFLDDQLHMTRAGYDIWARTLEEIVR